jgi:hypothetical protein
MPTDIWRDFDPNLDLPRELKNARYIRKPDVDEDQLDEQDLEADTESDDNSQEDIGRNGDDILDAPDSYEVISQTVRTGSDGRQLVDVVIEVEDVDGAINYEVRVT